MVSLLRFFVTKHTMFLYMFHGPTEYGTYFSYIKYIQKIFSEHLNNVYYPTVLTHTHIPTALFTLLVFKYFFIACSLIL